VALNFIRNYIQHSEVSVKLSVPVSSSYPLLKQCDRQAGYKLHV